MPVRRPGSIKVLIVRDKKEKALFAHLVPVKGADEEGFAVKSIVDDVVWLGYTKVVLKTDNEPAFFKLLQASLRDLRIEGLGQIMRENSPPQSTIQRECGSGCMAGEGDGAQDAFEP